jgi:hypothetical protein
MNTKIIIPFRDRGIDPRRAANLEVVQAWWYAHGFTPQIVDDGLSGGAQFNRHRAYNRAVERFPETEVFVFTGCGDGDEDAGAGGPLHPVPLPLGLDD